MTTQLRPDAVLYQDNHIIAVNKDWTVLVQGDRTGDPTLADAVRTYLKIRFHKPGNVFLGTIHRLDRPTSGIVLFARTSKGLERMTGLFRERAVKKVYWAVTVEAPPRDRSVLRHTLGRDRHRNKSYVTTAGETGSREAVLGYRHIASARGHHLLEIDLHTGRHHQIRAQLSAIGLHIRGDLKYGAEAANPGGGIHLHARSLSFVHPIKQAPVCLIAQPPDDELWRVFENIADSTS